MVGLGVYVGVGGSVSIGGGAPPVQSGTPLGLLFLITQTVSVSPPPPPPPPPGGGTPVGLLITVTR